MTNRKTLPKRKQHIEFNVTQKHIDEAVCGHSRHCGIALAMAEKLDLAHGYIDVSARALKFTKGNLRWRAFVSNRVIGWFYRFDQWGKGLAEKPEPFRFEAAFEAYAWKADKERAAIKLTREAELRAERKAAGIKPKVYQKRERLAGANIAA